MVHTVITRQRQCVGNVAVILNRNMLLMKLHFNGLDLFRTCFQNSAKYRYFATFTINVQQINSSMRSNNFCNIGDGYG